MLNKNMDIKKIRKYREKYVQYNGKKQCLLSLSNNNPNTAK